jgi:polyketide synthase Type III
MSAPGNKTAGNWSFMWRLVDIPLIAPLIHSIGTATPSRRFTQDETFEMAGYASPRILEIFRNCDIDYRHFYIKTGQKREETAGELNQRYLEGALEIGCRALVASFESAEVTARDIDLLVVCSSTGYVCPDLGTRLAGHMKFRPDVQRSAVLGLGCAGAIPALQRAWDFVRSHPDKTAAMLAVEICSACYVVDDTMDTVIGNAICADGAAAFVIRGATAPRAPAVVDFESFVDTEHLDKVGFDTSSGKLRIVLANAVRNIAGPMIERAIDALLARNSVCRSEVRFWIAHPGGRKVIDNVQHHLGLSDTQVRFSRSIMRNYGNMSSPTVMYVLDEVMRKGDPRQGDIGVMVALGPGMAAEAALIRW